MTDDNEKGTKVQLALALAQGVTASAWARHHKVPKRTACRWAREPEIRKAVEAFRRRTLDRAVGMMVKLAPSSVAKIAVLGTEAESETVRLRALRTIFVDMITVSKYVGLEARIVEIEEIIRERTVNETSAG